MGRQNNRRKKGTARKASSKRYHQSGCGGKQNINALMDDLTAEDILIGDQVGAEELLPPQPEEPVIPMAIVIPGEGTSPGMAQAYVDKLQQHYDERGTEVDIVVFSHDMAHPEVELSTEEKIEALFQEYFKDHELVKAEIHAHGGLGAYVAYRMLGMMPTRIQRVFFIGGAPSEALSRKTKSFCQKTSKLCQWLYKQGFTKLCAEILSRYNPSGVMNSDPEFIRKNPRTFLNQIMLVGSWATTSLLRVEDGRAYYIPCGDAYDYVSAVSSWYQHNVGIAKVSDGYSTSDTKMTVEELFAIMEKCKLNEKETGP